ncbi:interferon regulatory factor 1 [Paramuricea clavata]|uniref:Interferon regulatory factor 1 n=1 Tax=Paramuricea clavata TaxID=317549 RepID=A0A6S7FTQ1_PARCT|nr:interferon regulatory factor 1 [Paramuricea clavata]
MKGKRDSLRVWLEKNLNANNIRGLEWKDRKNKIFKIRWKHASKHGWSSELDGCVFREWAIYSGKFKPGETPQEQPKVWKANFRCALNALPDIQEIVSERETRGNEAQKVFHMRPHVLKQGRRNRASSRMRDVPGYQASTSHLKYIEEPNMVQVGKSVWTHRSFARPVSENPPPLLHIRSECCSSIERQTEKAAFSSYVKTIKENEPVLPEHKIIDLIDSWSHELKEQHDSRFYNTAQMSNPGGYVESSIGVYQNANYSGGQTTRIPASRYYLTYDTSDESTQTCFEYVSRI